MEEGLHGELLMWSGDMIADIQAERVSGNDDHVTGALFSGKLSSKKQQNKYLSTQLKLFIYL